MSTQVITLNIGLDGVQPLTGTTNGTPIPTTAGKVFACAKALRARSFVVLNNKIVQSDTELTWAVEVAYDSSTAVPLYRNQALYGAIRSAADALNQDVLAVYFQDRGRGTMKGRTVDHDHLWGTFNPDLFFLPTGERLSATLRRAA